MSFYQRFDGCELWCPQCLSPSHQSCLNENNAPSVNTWNQINTISPPQSLILSSLSPLFLSSVFLLPRSPNKLSAQRLPYAPHPPSHPSSPPLLPPSQPSPPHLVSSSPNSSSPYPLMPLFHSWVVKFISSEGMHREEVLFTNVCECQHLVSVCEPGASTPVLRQMWVAGLTKLKEKLLNLPPGPLNLYPLRDLGGWGFGGGPPIQLFRFTSKSSLQTRSRVYRGLDAYLLTHT